MVLKIKICCQNIVIEKPVILILEKVILYTCKAKCVYVCIFKCIIVNFVADAKKVKSFLLPIYNYLCLPLPAHIFGLYSIIMQPKCVGILSRA